MRLIENFRLITSKEWATRLAIAVGVISIFTFAVFVIAPKVNADAPVQPGEHLLSVHEGGTERGVMTHASTLRDALAEAHITTTDQDLVEPSLDTQLVGGNYDVNIYRALPITIVDGVTEVRVMSPYRAADQIVDHAGMTLNPEDTTTMTSSQDVINGPGLVLTIHRATPFTLILYGKPVQSYTQAKTVNEMLQEKGIKLAGNDTVSVSQTSPIASGMTVEIWREGVQTVTIQQPVPFQTQEIQDADQPVGYKQVKTPGQDGTEMVTYQITVKNGVEASRQAIQTVVTGQPTQQVEVIGIKVSLPPGSHTDWMAAAGISASDYGYVDFIVSHEDGSWDPCKVQGGAINCSYSGSMGYGLVQATPGYKMGAAGADWRTNPITQLIWATGYAQGRYGSWGGAYQHWVQWHNW